MFQGPKGYIAQIYEVHCSMETVQQNGRFTLFSSKFPSNIYSVLFVNIPFISERRWGTFLDICLPYVHG